MFSTNENDINPISSINIEFRNGYFEVLRLMTTISRHRSFTDAVQRQKQEERVVKTLTALL